MSCQQNLSAFKNLLDGRSRQEYKLNVFNCVVTRRVPSTGRGRVVVDVGRGDTGAVQAVTQPVVFGFYLLSLSYVVASSVNGYRHRLLGRTGACSSCP